MTIMNPTGKAQVINGDSQLCAARIMGFIFYRGCGGTSRAVAIAD
jgi:hypothetical protein